MANMEEDSSKVTALYPDPPSFWKAFTAENLGRFDSLKQDYADRNGLDVDTVVRIPDIPEELAYLQPPAEPSDSKWRLFSEPQAVGMMCGYRQNSMLTRWLHSSTRNCKA